MKSFQINNRSIGEKFPPYIIAELSGNHNGQLDKIFELIKAAKEAGADAIKIQSYTPDTMTLNSNKDDFQVKKGLWKGYNLYELYKVAHTPFEWHQDIFAFALEIGITLFSTPFDETALDLLEKLDCPAYKIASFENNDLPLIKAVAQTGKPMIISTGLADFNEISDCVSTARENGCENLCLLHCISGYPTPTDQSNIKTMVDIKKHFNTEIGLSDHSMNNIAAMAAISLGASVIEKHFTIDRKEKSVDSEFSMEPSDLKHLVNTSLETWKALGDVTYSLKKAENENKSFRRSLYFVKPLKKNEYINKSHIRRIRPGFGLKPIHFDDVIGKKVRRDIEFGEPVKWSDFDE